ncbi:transporter [Thiothrix subterranea]|uniref:Transporter n=2 Tax=Thiothrix TaxID=1030 RepID=A0AA51MQ08_9GAMM|nr:transporter [Thiothrix subterranea]MDQ5767177.1 transporter [Thiothrix subterranea]WML87960.1 transporter [Thiothrix subterranea]
MFSLKVLLQCCIFLAVVFSNVQVLADEGDSALTTIGKKDENTKSHLLFLRESEVLLKPKDMYFSLGFNYSTDEKQINLRKSKDRSFSIPLSIGYGVTQDTEVNASIALIQNKSETATINSVVSNNGSGIGNATIGAMRKLKAESNTSPSITASANLSFPLDKKSNSSDASKLAVGSNFRTAAVGLGISKSIDPAVVFLNVGYNHILADDQDGIRTQPGKALTYSIGSGLAVNRSISMSGRISGQYQTETQYNGKALNGSSSEPISLGGTVDYRLDDKTRLETSFDVGLTNDASDVGMGLTLIRNVQ